MAYRLIFFGSDIGLLENPARALIFLKIFRKQKSLALTEPFMNKNYLCVIPARFASTRLPGKPLLEIKGLPLVMWCYRRAEQAKVFDRICVATDDQRIMDTVAKHGGYAVMTSPSHVRGTDRVHEVALKEQCSHIVNLQGDEPEIPVELIVRFARELENLDNNSLLTAVSHATISETGNPNVVKAVLNVNGEALYFSRSPIPFDRDGKGGPVLKHYGIYGFTHDGISRFCQFPQGTLEQRESLEQLRALEYGMKIKCINYDFDSHGIDTPEDLESFRLQAGEATDNYER